MNGFEMRVELASPVAIGARAVLTLDAVLFGILSDLADDAPGAEVVRGRVPIARINEVFLASAAEFEDPVTQRHTQYGSIKGVTDLRDADERLRPLVGRSLPKLDTTSGKHKAHNSAYEVVTARAVIWRAVGNPEECARILRAAGALGALRKIGYGMIGNVTCRPCDPASVLVSGGKLARPIPVDRAEAVLGAAGSGMMESSVQIRPWRPPFWDVSDQLACRA